MQFGSHMYDPEKVKNYVSTPFDETVAAVGDLLASGKIKQWGLSNENAYGVTMMCESAKRQGVALPVSIQNDYSITDRCVAAAGVCCTNLFFADLFLQNFSLDSMRGPHTNMVQQKPGIHSDFRHEGQSLSSLVFHGPRFQGESASCLQTHAPEFAVVVVVVVVVVCFVCACAVLLHLLLVCSVFRVLVMCA